MELVKAAVLLLVLVFAAVAHGLYFHIGETEQRCFIEEVPQETMIVGEGRKVIGTLLLNQIMIVVWYHYRHYDLCASALCLTLSAHELLRSASLSQLLPPPGKYKTQLFDNTKQTWLPSSPGIGMHVEVCFPCSSYITSFSCKCRLFYGQLTLLGVSRTNSVKGQ